MSAAKDGLLALNVGVGLGVLSEMMEAELDEVVGRKHAKIAQRTAVRHGHEDARSRWVAAALLSSVRWPARLVWSTRCRWRPTRTSLIARPRAEGPLLRCVPRRQH